MANRKRGEVDLDLAGQNLVLRFGFNELCELEERCGGQPLDYLLTADGRGMSRRFIREAVYVGLGKTRGRMTSSKIGDLISKDLASDEGALMKIVAAVLTAVMYGNGAKDEEIQSMRSAMESSEDDDDNDLEQIISPEEIEAVAIPLDVPLDLTGTI